MKRFINLLCFATIVTSASANTIKQLALDPMKIIQVPVSRDNLTMVQFPSPISDIEGAFISPEPGASTKFQISFRPHSHFFSVRALLPAAAVTLNVVWKGKTYVFELVESDAPILSLILIETPAHPSAPKTMIVELQPKKTNTTASVAVPSSNTSVTAPSEKNSSDATKPAVVIPPPQVSHPKTPIRVANNYQHCSGAVPSRHSMSRVSARQNRFVSSSSERWLVPCQPPQWIESGCSCAPSTRVPIWISFSSY